MLPVPNPFPPMLANAQDELPEGDGWLYEPKWDGFRALVFRDGDELALCSRSGQPLARYFPEVVSGLKAALPPRVVVDGEIILPGPRGLDFDALQARLHPAASRVEKLSRETPAGFVAFDLLALGDEDWRGRSTEARRAALWSNFRPHGTFFVTPSTRSREEAARWFHDFEGAGCDGVIARRLEEPYAGGERRMVKVKHGRTADCVVGGFREGKTPGTVGSLLLGLYDEDGVLHHVGHTSSFSAKEKRELRELLREYEGGASFGAGRTPDAPSRWSKKGAKAGWTPLRPELVCEVRYDYLQGPRFRHAATFLRWRSDKPARECSYQQLVPPNAFSLAAIIELKPA